MKNNDSKQLGHVNKFILTNGLSEDRENVSDLSPYSGFNAELGSDFDKDEFSYLGGKRYTPLRNQRRRPVSRQTQQTRGTRQTAQRRVSGAVKRGISYTPIGAGANYVRTLSTPDSIEARRKQRQERLRQEQLTQQRLIAGQGSNDALINQLNNQTITPASTPMKTSTKILIGVGVVAVLGTIGFMLYKKFKK